GLVRIDVLGGPRLRTSHLRSRQVQRQLWRPRLVPRLQLRAGVRVRRDVPGTRELLESRRDLPAELDVQQLRHRLWLHVATARLQSLLTVRAWPGSDSVGRAMSC